MAHFEPSSGVKEKGNVTRIYPMGANSFFKKTGGKNENDRVTSPEIVPILFKEENLILGYKVCVRVILQDRFFPLKKDLGFTALSRIFHLYLADR